MRLSTDLRVNLLSKQLLTNDGICWFAEFFFKGVLSAYQNMIIRVLMEARLAKAFVKQWVEVGFFNLNHVSMHLLLSLSNAEARTSIKITDF